MIKNTITAAINKIIDPTFNMALLIGLLI